MPRGGPKRAAAVKALAKTKQTKDSDDEESEWEQEEESQTSSSQHADKEDSPSTMRVIPSHLPRRR